MKKRTIVILSILLLLIPTIFVVLKGMLVTYSVVTKEEKRFCPPSPIDIVQPKDRKLIKTGDLSFECRNLKETRSEIETAVNQYGGFIAKERLYYGYNKETSNQELTIRVPSESFDALVADLSKGAQRVDKRSIEIEDVTDQYLDTETRLAVKRQLESRYRELLSEAQNVTDVLGIEEQLAILREDIESAEGQLKRLDDQITLSTLDVTFYVRLNESPEFARHFRNGVGNGWENLIWFFVAMLNIWPFILIVIVLIGSFIFRRKRKTK